MSMLNFALAVIKAASELVTAGFGIWGLVADPKHDQKQISHHRRTAVRGIVIGLFFAISSTGIEYVRERVAEREHAKEIRRLLEPLGAVSISLTFRIEQHSTSGPLNDLRQFLASQPKNMVNHQDLPQQLRDELTIVNSVEQTNVSLFHTATCDFKPPFVADIFFYPWPFGLGQSRNVFWTYDKVSGQLTYTRTLSMRPWWKKGAIESVEDIPESAIVINSDAFKEPVFAFDSFIFNAAEGRQFVVKHDEFVTKGWDQLNSYCHVFKPVA